MLGTRVITAVVLLVLLVAVLLSKSLLAIAVVAGGFFAAAAWEALRLFRSRQPMLGAAIWTLAFAFIVYQQAYANARLLMLICVLIWIVRLAPSLKLGLPPIDGLGSRLLSGIYGVAILGCFVAILALYAHSPWFLLSAMALVWVADIGAYFSGKAFGKHKLAPSISPGKSWEGAIGGWFAVLLLAALSTRLPALRDTFASELLARHGWLAWVAVMTVIVAASVCGDLFESQLKRRAGMKDSSALLPGHGGVLDRIDALIPVLPIAFLVAAWR